MAQDATKIADQFAIFNEHRQDNFNILTACEPNKFWGDKKKLCEKYLSLRRYYKKCSEEFKKIDDNINSKFKFIV